MNLTEREKIILGEIVQNFIENGSPVSSSSIATSRRISMSAATVRSVMSDLEKKGYIHQPHTSAGRVPRTTAYRAYVDGMMKTSRLSPSEKDSIRSPIHPESELEEILREVSRILAHLSRQLGIIVTPRMEDGIFERMELVRLSSNRLLVVITIESGLIRTIQVEVQSTLKDDNLHLVTQLLNERLSGLKISAIRTNFDNIVKDIKHEESGLVRIFTTRAKRMFDFGEDADVYVMGTHHIMQPQDFSDVQTVSSVVEMVEDRKVIIHLLDSSEEKTDLVVRIGEEMQQDGMQECSIISARYHVGSISGILGVLGPTRMNYSKLVPLVNFTAQALTNAHGEDQA
ncbi:MAG: heat-inducible transcriptional repressor HrcA [Calditrichia bacterium]